MEHLLPETQRAPIRVPNYQTQPDEDGNIATVNDCAELFEAVVRSCRSPNPPTNQEQADLWIEHCHKGRVYNLCHGLLDQCYFGLLYQFLGPNIVVADFTALDDDGQVYLSTARLEKYLLAWQAQLQPLDEEEKTQLRMRLHSMLDQVAVILRHLAWFLDWSYEHVPVIQAYPGDNEPLGNTQFACVVLHQALAHAWIECLDCDTRLFTEFDMSSHLPWLQKRMEREGWCPYTIRKLKVEFGTEGMVYGYWLQTVRTDTADHGACSEVVCTANDVMFNEEVDREHLEYDTRLRHVNDGCDCWIVAAPTADITAILERGEIPILRIGTDDGYRLSLYARAADSTTDGGRYIAISHVWVDGLGSPYSNKIAQCQLTRIADRLGMMEAKEGCGELNIWVDTLCIPMNPSDSHLRRLAIFRMHHVYRAAYAVVVMDADLLSMQSSPSVEELGMRLCISAWSSRLWTFQEGALNDRLLVMTTESLADVDQCLKGHYQRMTNGFSVQLDLSHSIAWTVEQLRDLRHIDSGIRNDFDSTQPFKDQDPETVLRAHKILAGIHDRTSTRADDEAIVIATFLDLPTSPIIAACGEGKMEALLKAMPSIPKSVLFTIGPRLQSPGLRWAPSTFMRAKGGGAIAPDPAALRKPLSKLDDQARGLWTFNPGAKFNLTSIPKFDPAHVVFEHSGVTYAFDVLAHTAHHGDLLDEKLLQSPERKANLAILLPDVSTITFNFIGVLVEVLEEMNDAEHKKAAKARYCMVVEVNSMFHLTSHNTSDDGVRNSTSIAAEWVEPRFWLVD